VYWNTPAGKADVVTTDETSVSNLINTHAAKYRYGVYRFEISPDGTFYRVELTNPDGRRTIVLTVFRDAFAETIKENSLAEAIVRNLDRELGATLR